MRSLRANLFLSVASLLLVAALVGFFLPRYFIDKDINTASSYVSKIRNEDRQHIDYLSRSWVIYRFTQAAAELDALVQSIQFENKTVWDIAGAALGQNPNIAVIQVTDHSQKSAVISPESAQLYTPLWARDQQGNLWIKIPEKEAIFSAIKDKENTYLLFPAQEQKEAFSFKPFEKETVKFSLHDSNQVIYQALRLQENRLFQKIKMIQQLIPLREKASGILQVDPSFEKGMAIFADEVFSTVPIADATEPNHFVIYRKEGPYVDLAQIVPQTSPEQPSILVGFSLSRIASAIARGLQKPVLLSDKTTVLQGFTPTGENLPIKALTLNSTAIVWEGVEYIAFNIPLEKIVFSFLYPKAETLALINYLHKVKETLLAKVSWNLISIILALLALSFFVLARMSKRITKPITQLALASEEIGKGNYENLHLPSTEKRHDEVATLTLSFKKMVAALQEREKIRSILNKVVSKEIASQILSSNIELGGEERKLTLLFSDIRGFTHLSETLPPQKVLKVLNDYMTRMCRIIDDTHGVVDKFVGDEIMALYGAPIDMENHAEKTIEAALLMIEELKRWNQERGENKPPLTVGIGIHTGVAVAGNMGAQDRLNYTVVGANVNLAARLCSAAEPMQILISEETYHYLKNPQKFHFEKLPPVLLKGIDKPVSLFAVSRNPTVNL